MIDIYILDLFVIGLLLLIVTLGSGWIARLPLSFALIYLLVGIILGPYGFGLIQLRRDDVFNADLLERITEFVVIISVFSCGLKIIHPRRRRVWDITARLIGFLMPISIFAIAIVAKLFLAMNWGEAILLGAILAPTDPVLASEVQLTDINDKDELRFGLTSEGGLNDALAFPFVYFGLFAIKDDNWNTWFKQWVVIDLIWAIAAGLIMGFVVAKAIVWIDQKIQKRRSADALMEDFVALSAILLTYSLTEVVNGYGFLAVFIAGLVFQDTYRNPERPLAQLEFIERLEKLLEVGTILLLGSILLWQPIVNYGYQSLIVIIFLFLIIRPVGAWISTIGKRPLASHRRHFHPATRWLFGWFGIRGVGSLYYLAYAFGHGLKDGVGEEIAWITYTTIVVSVVIHGISATPLMSWYERNIANEKKTSLPETLSDLE
ncbi:sodium/proton antiporter, CPA1 family [Trichormus variabilis ATCC 29413]|uniref:Sodium/proton antiporter, CPA1 family n=2 Tax=Anabaena variabilis TaxID=264691 RepID=Q3MBB2_TRIV2|nr:MULTISPECIES: sodium:proton antiporter [Nostocaceae]ABA21724.1 sodium/proton antiporter, CPA1 family [Trichormus variabilis ATCC 29413]MBC1213073.1 sodium:proton antiporter [Trichormus variabilis ARAD]MBC1257687.1 sodium:proton antiporter [Trichormus variabilis V5]MBC1266546.1 sodium:proton antiporter [Trichormus variabilis FSR]MBC1303170.1 sodium:proton antiporter [Trichormus variabilis N2B]